MWLQSLLPLSAVGFLEVEVTSVPSKTDVMREIAAAVSMTTIAPWLVVLTWIFKF